METLYLYTEEFFLKNRLKAGIKRLLGSYERGPQAVSGNLISGLNGLHADFKLNVIPSQKGIACVLSGPKVLQWAIIQKKAGVFSHVVAGPNIEVPKDSRSVIFDDAIDIFLVPSPWVANFCDSFSSGFKRKVRVWASGIKPVEIQKNKHVEFDCLVYKKSVPEKFYDNILAFMGEQQVVFRELKYGEYSKQQYYNFLDRAKYAVFFSISESQGIALNEAWMHNVPTLVWQPTIETVENRKNLPPLWEGSSAAPYLTDDTGYFFSTVDEFKEVFPKFMASLHAFSPHTYHLTHFTQEISAQKFLSIIKELKQ